MKKKLLYFILFFTLVLVAGCNKEKESPVSDATPTPTATSTPTPTPANLAKENLEKLPAALDQLAALNPESKLDYSNGIGYDITMNVSLSSKVLELLALYGLDLNGLESITAHGTMDIKDCFSMDMTLGLNNSDIVNALLYANSEHLMFNLPKYSTNFASMSWTELLGDSGIEDFSFNLQSSQEMQNILQDHMIKFIDCFQEVEGFSKDATIGTGNYIITGDKYTVQASSKDMYAVLESLAAELKKISPAYSMDTEELRPDENITFVLDFYSGTEGNYAWAAYPDNSAEDPLIFVNTPAGFCLYTIEEETPSVIMSSVATSDQSGEIIIAATEEQEEGYIEYEFDDTSLYMNAEIDTLDLTLDLAKKGETLEYEITMVVDGISVIIEETVAKEQIDMTCTIASFGVKFATITCNYNLRAYNEVPAPQNIADVETWSANLDQLTLVQDLFQLTADYPFLADLILGSEDNSYEDDFYEDNIYFEEEPFVVPEDYTDEFSSMTGYTIDSDGYVDFSPLENEVLAIGKPSTGYDSVTLSDTQKQSLLDYASGLFTDYYYEAENYYSVWGSIEFDTVESYYQTEHYYADNNDYNNFVFLNFDAVSGDFIDISIYTSSLDKTLSATTDVLKILGIDATLSADELKDSILMEDYLLYLYEDDSCYGINIEAYKEY